MKIYFGKSTEQDLDTYGSDGLLAGSDGYYSGCVEFGTNAGGVDDVVIHDGCNRSIPISVTNLYELCVILSEYSNIKTELDAAKELMDHVQSDDIFAATCEHGHIHYESV